MPHVIKPKIVRGEKSSKAVSIVTVRLSDLNDVLLKEVYTKSIEPLRATKPDRIFASEFEATLLMPIVNLAAKVLEKPFDADGSIADDFQKQGLGWYALSKVLSFSNSKEVTNALIDTLIQELPYVAPRIESIRTLIVDREKLKGGKPKPGDGTIKVRATDIIDDLLTSPIIGINPRSYVTKDISTEVSGDVVKDLFATLGNYAGVPVYKELVPDQRLGIVKSMIIVEQALEYLAFPERVLNPPNAGTFSLREQDFYALASAYAFYRKIIDSPDSYAAASVARMDAVANQARIDVFRTTASNYSWMMMNFFTASKRISTGMIYGMFKNIESLLNVLPINDVETLKVISTTIASYKPDGFTGGANLFDTLHAGLFSAISESVAGDRALLIPQAIADMLKFDLTRPENPGGMSSELVPMGFTGIDGWRHKKGYVRVWEQEEVLLRRLRGALKAIRAQVSDIHETFKLCAGPDALEDAAFFNLPSDLFSISPQISWTATPDAIPHRDIEKLPSGTVSLPRFVDNKPFWAGKTFVNVFWREFIAKHAAREYNTRRYYWPAVEDVTLVDPWFAKFFRSYIPYCYVDDVIPTREDRTSVLSIRDMMSRISSEMGLHYDFFGHVAAALLNEDDYGLIVSGLSSMFSIYRCDTPDDVKDDMTEIPRSCSLLYPTIPTVYGMPFQMFIDLQPTTLSSDSFVYADALSAANETVRYLFVLHKFFPQPGPSVIVPMYTGGTSWMSISVRQDIANAAVTNHALTGPNDKKEWRDFIGIMPMTQSPAGDILKSAEIVFMAVSDYLKQTKTSFTALGKMSSSLLSVPTFSADTKSFNVRLDGGGVITMINSPISVISAILPHIFMRDAAPADFGFSWDMMKQWNYLDYSFVDSGMGMLTTTKIMDDSIVEFLDDDEIKVSSEAAKEINGIRHLNNTKRFVVTTQTEPGDHDSNGDTHAELLGDPKSGDPVDTDEMDETANPEKGEPERKSEGKKDEKKSESKAKKTSDEPAPTGKDLEAKFDPDELTASTNGDETATDLESGDAKMDEDDEKKVK